MILSVDIGGTSIKSGLISPEGAMVELPQVKIDSSPGACVDDFITAIKQIVTGHNIGGIGICIPGPFDYINGISLMEHKFRYLKNLNVAAILKSAIPDIHQVPIIFCHDANAFLAGEMWKGVARGAARAVGITLGTGVGVSCFANGGFITDKLGSPAPEVSIWRRTYCDGIVEDYISTNWLVRQYQQYVPGYDAVDGGRGISAAAQQGDPAALEVFGMFGENLGKIMTDHILNLAPDIIVFGGQISKNLSLFENSLNRVVANNENVPIVAGILGTTASLYGVAAMLKDYERLG